MAAPSQGGLDAHQLEFLNLVRANAHRHRLHEVFRDFCELAALTISNSVDRLHYARREARYLEVIKRYTRDEAERFAHMLALVVQSLDGGLRDCLGELFMALELGDHWKGQFFTPYCVAVMMASMTLHDLPAKVDARGFVTVCEPAAGSGAMLIAVAEVAQAQGINYQRSLHATAVDVDATAVHMAYVQLSLLHMPALVVHGNTITATEWEHWATPAHVMGGWDQRLRRGADSVDQRTPLATHDEVASEPATSVVRSIVDARLEQLSLFE